MASALTPQSAAREGAIPNFGYVYGFTSGSYQLTDDATGKGYRGRGTMRGQRFPGPGATVVGNLVKNSRFRPNTVQGTLVVPYRMTVSFDETLVTDNGTKRCRDRRTLDSPYGLLMKLSVFPSAERVRARFRLFGPLGSAGNCSRGLSTEELLAYQWFPLRPFLQERFSLRLRASGRIEDRTGNRHTLRWDITANLVRLQSLVP